MVAGVTLLKKEKKKMKKKEVIFGANTKVVMEEKEFKKEGNKWVEVSSENVEITNEEYNNYVNSGKFFTGIGGYERKEKSYTCEGYIVTRINSISPSKEIKITRQFKITSR